MAAAVAAALFASTLSAASARAATAPVECAAPSAGASLFVDAQCVDPDYATPIVDSEADVSDPVTAHLVTGHFEGTDVQFRVYLPPAQQWDGRFFQFTYPLEGQEPTDSVAFGASHGAYTVQTTAIAGYRHSAAAAKASRDIAAAYYGVSAEEVNGYLYGWSGGSYQVVGALENTDGVWQGAVPIVQGVPVSIPNNYSVRALAGFILAPKKDAIVAALRPGGSGNPRAALDGVERAVLDEALSLGIPLQAFEDFDQATTSAVLDAFAPTIQAIDPTYAEDFWNAPGYLGTEASALGNRFRAALAADNTDANRWRLALLVYHRYQVPSDRSFTVYDQFRNASGQPIPPQRAVLFADFIAPSISGGAQFTGDIHMKTIAVEGLVDFDAFPWHGDWYGQKIRGALGRQTDDTYRIWYTENATHNPYTVSETANRHVGYMPVVYQALLDVAAWAEDGTAPPTSTRYALKNGQITVPNSASARQGIQATVELTVLGTAHSRPVRAGAKVDFLTKVQIPRGTGTLVSVEWDPEGDGTFTPVSFSRDTRTVTVRTSATYATAGSYAPVIRIGTQRGGNAQDTQTTVLNLDRASVTVK